MNRSVLDRLRHSSFEQPRKNSASGFEPDNTGPPGDYFFDGAMTVDMQNEWHKLNILDKSYRTMKMRILQGLATLYEIPGKNWLID
ncbi:MAG: hypothetical protein NTAFB09_09500 [Nitrosospira sp.]